MSAYKKFDPELYAKYDPAKHIVIDFFERSGHKAIVNPDQYGIDLIIDDKFFVEVEVKTEFTGSTFISRRNGTPHKTLNIPTRKFKFITDSTMFCVVNVEGTHAMFTPGKIVRRCRRDTVPNCGAELFFIVPIRFVKLLRIA